MSESEKEMWQWKQSENDFISGCKYGRGPVAEDWGEPLEAEKGKKMDSQNVQKEWGPVNILTLA